VPPPKSSFFIAKIKCAAGRRFSALSSKAGSSTVARLLAFEGLLAAIVVTLANAYTAMFASRMSATATQIGLITSLPQIFALFILIPGTLLASRMRDQRRPVEMTLLLAGFFYGLAGFSPYAGSLRTWFLIGMISLANVPLVVYNTSWQNYFSNIVPPANRNDYYTRRTSMTSFAGILVVQAVGLLLGSIQSAPLRILIYQICYWLAFLVSLLQFRIFHRLPNNFQEFTSKGKSHRELSGAVKEILASKKYIIFLVIAVLFHFGFYMSWPLFFLLQVNYLHANEVWLSLIAVPGSILTWLTVRPWGKYIERHGSSKALIFGCVGVAVYPFLTAATAYLPAGFGLPGLAITSLLVSITTSAFQLALLQCLLEVVPEKYKNLNLSIYANFLILTNAVAPMIGVLIYNVCGANLRAMTLTLFLSGLIRFAGALLFLLRWQRLRKAPECGIKT
jgi:MFS family permease